MMELQAPLRPATPEDADALCELINFAGEGLPLYLWGRKAKTGESPWDVGHRRARREEGSFSYHNAVVLEEGGKVAACLVGYPLAEKPEPIAADIPAIIRPMEELEREAPGSWYLNVLAAYPGFRGRGYGTRLLRVAEDLARSKSRARLSIIVNAANSGARRLYERVGYRLLAERPMVKNGWQGEGEAWLLLIKEL